MPALSLNRPVTATADRILDATERLLGRFGFNKTTVDDIATEAGVSKRTIYLHFAGKEEVALASIDRVVGRVTDRLREIARTDAHPTDRVLHMLVARILGRFDSVRSYHQSLEDMFRSLRPTYLARRQRYFLQHFNFIAAGSDHGCAGADALYPPFWHALPHAANLARSKITHQRRCAKREHNEH